MAKQLECRVIITRRADQKIDLGMFDPLNVRYEPLGVHGPGERVIDKAVANLRDSIVRAGHSVSFSDVRAPR